MRGRRAFVDPDHLPAAPRRLRADGREADRDAPSTSGFGGTSAAFAGPAIGQGIFAALLMLMTLQVVFLAPSSTAGAISLEREKQTLELLIATPDQLAGDRRRQAALGAGLRLPAHRRVDPADGRRLRVRRRRARGRPARLHRADRDRAGSRLVRAAVLEHRQADDGRDGDHDLRRAGRSRSGRSSCWSSGRRWARFDDNGQSAAGLFGIRSPAILAYLNPFIAQADVMCGTESTFGGGWCSVVNGLVPSNDGVVFNEERRRSRCRRPMPVIAEQGVRRGGMSWSSTRAG